MGLLSKKTAIVTGAGSGIGRSIAELYAANGASVIVTDIDEKGGQATVDAILKANGQAHFIKADSSKAGDNEKIVQEAVAKFGKVDIACNNAGIGGLAAPTGEYPIDAWDKVIAINLSGVFYGMRYQIPAMLLNKGGVIINMASILGQVGFAGSPAYVAAKHGVVGLTKTAAIEYSSKGIRVVAVGPGFIETPLLTDKLPEEKMKALATLHPIGRLGKPEEVAELVLWLSSEKASFVTGGYYAVDGAYLAP
ncbi:glucose 1-dehydrogenase [Pseudoflavitalea sp. G-6-1-2]|uniref:SDR family NAD(P)-dependent oxidoreductase n=1 Tax=Pseudoflavitalea sp. G-6-1-2 TaxID=2728841 RepID=UPI00146AA2AC|nr:glucose 1-dehydrogenase [Pseudoflavitalea sp. G-6-1-2]NML22223.1 glucose 1-dehydrogenase [Pseudoflavitalea sp. G-6-1-2]